MDFDAIDWMLIFTGVGVLICIGRLLWVNKLAKNWFETTGLVTELKLTKANVNEFKGRTLELSYEYNYANKEYIGNSTSIADLALPRTFGFTSPSKKTVNRILGAYRSEKVVPVYVDPRNPERSCLNRDLDPVHVGYFSLIFTLSVVVFLIDKWV